MGRFACVYLDIVRLHPGEEDGNRTKMLPQATRRISLKLRAVGGPDRPVARLHLRVPWPSGTARRSMMETGTNAIPL
jgi:hypothetical protein